MKSLKQHVSEIISRTNTMIRRTLPRPSTLFAARYFGDKPVNVIEIGTFKGDNAKSILKVLNVRKLVCIDPYIIYGDYEGDGSYNEVKHIADNIHKMYNALNRKKLGKVEWKKEMSTEAAKEIENKYYDFIYVDGNHTYKYVLKDLELYLPKLKDDGIIAGHDIEHSDVARAVSKFVVENKLKLTIKTPDWMITK